MTCREDPFRNGGKGDSCWHLNRGLKMFEQECLAHGWIEKNFDDLVIQWAWRPYTPASAATHTRGGVADIKGFLVNTDIKQRVAFRCGLLPFHRFPPTFPEHGHVIALGCTNLHYSAQKQVDSYFKRGMDGLRTERRFPGPANMPYVTVQQALRNREDNMPSLDELFNSQVIDNPDPEHKPKDKKVSLADLLQRTFKNAYYAKHDVDKLQVEVAAIKRKLGA